jgi:hypothetical protein
MEHIGDIIRRVVGKDLKEQKRNLKIQTALDECLGTEKVKPTVTAVRKGTLFLKVGSQVEKSEIESFLQKRIINFLNERLKTNRFEKVKVRVEK